MPRLANRRSPIRVNTAGSTLGQRAASAACADVTTPSLMLRAPVHGLSAAPGARRSSSDTGNATPPVTRWMRAPDAVALLLLGGLGDACPPTVSAGVPAHRDHPRGETLSAFEREAFAERATGVLAPRVADRLEACLAFTYSQLAEQDAASKDAQPILPLTSQLRRPWNRARSRTYC